MDLAAPVPACRKGAAQSRGRRRQRPVAEFFPEGAGPKRTYLSKCRALVHYLRTDESSVSKTFSIGGGLGLDGRVARWRPGRNRSPRAAACPAHIFWLRSSGNLWVF